MVNSTFEGSSSEQLVDPGLQLGFESDYLCALKIMDYVHQVMFCTKEFAAGGAKHKVLLHNCHVKEVVEAELAGLRFRRTSRSR